ncbi:uncharacterized protein PAC_15492 [Phialocephala subalpina]|uniref:Uncharacterized protein n=1 Tax=Phialocephala subalpina TaxID=576137 RepID=A0A1L7XKM6_9HELO|nr:uncharacterized protein PAC_15492 [Phialocephala subalpina]
MSHFRWKQQAGGGALAAIESINLSSSFDQYLGHFYLPAVHCGKQWYQFVLVRFVYPSSIFDEQVDQGELSTIDGADQWCVPLGVLFIGSDSFIEQQLHQSELASLNNTRSEAVCHRCTVNALILNAIDRLLGLERKLIRPCLAAVTVSSAAATEFIAVEPSPHSARRAFRFARLRCFCVPKDVSDHLSPIMNYNLQPQYPDVDIHHLKVQAKSSLILNYHILNPSMPDSPKSSKAYSGPDLLSSNDAPLNVGKDLFASLQRSIKG